MAVEINIPPVLQPLTDHIKQIEVSGRTIGECLEALVNRYPGLKSRVFNRRGKLTNGINIFLNGESVYPEPLARAVCGGDKIHIAFVVLGG